MKNDMAMKKSQMGRAPSYWWDFVDNARAVIVQSDLPGCEELARFTAKPGQAETDDCVESAELLIQQLKSGQVSPWELQKKAA